MPVSMIENKLGNVNHYDAIIVFVYCFYLRSIFLMQCILLKHYTRLTQLSWII